MRSVDRMCNMKTFYNPNEKIWYGVKENPSYGPDASIGVVALESLLREPEHISQICFQNDKKYTNLELAQLIVSVAEYFKKLKFEQGDIIGVCASNSDYLAPLVLGAMLAGLTVSTLDPSFDKDGIKHIYSITKPKLMFCDGSIYDNVEVSLKEINLDIPIYTMKDHKEGVPRINEFLKEKVDVTSYRVNLKLKFGRNQIAAILCSSGTTGKPKGVCMTHSMLLENKGLPLEPSDRLLCFSTLYWLTGLLSLVVGTVRGATRIISDRPYCADDFLETIQKYKATMLITAPSHLALAVVSPKLKSYDLSSVEIYFCGGSAVQHSLVEKFLPYIPKAKFIAAYGMSEICDSVANGESSPDGSTGKLIPNVTVKIIDDANQKLGPNGIGEICIKMLYPWPGYYGNDLATKEIYIDGWIHSGDLGYFDDTGKLYIIDRKKDILKYNNFHFYPTEIEGVIARLPGVIEVCVCGIPDLVSSYLPAAAIVCAKGSMLTETDVYKYVAENMAHFKQLRGGVYFLESLPKTASGKNIRRDITKLLEKLRNDKIAK